MPELPEVETVMRGLEAALSGRLIQHAVLHRTDLRFVAPANLAQLLRGRRVTGFRRRAKYFFMRLDNGQSLLVHLGMSGRFLIGAAGQNSETAHEHLVIEADGVRAGFVDPRRFGCLDLVATADEDRHRLLAGLGPEPLSDDFTPKTLSAALAGKGTPIKSALLDQGIVAGLGNIYVAEALFSSGISPRRMAGSVAGARAAKLVPAIKNVLTAAIAAGGSSLRDYVRPDGELGYFQHAWKVYGREGEACERCPGTPGCDGIKRIVQSGRSTFFCARHQR
jgi:formamidopyrimidine-DNA glycosylase